MTTLTITPKQVRPENGAIPWQGPADAGMTVGQVVRSTDTGFVKASDATSAGVKGLVGIVIFGSRHSSDGAIVTGEEVTVILGGPVYLGAAVTLDTTKRYYVGTAGLITDTVTGFERVLGYAVDTHTLFIAPVNTQPTS